jgi:MFS superfamily sulfate permease-like transporter
VTRFTAGIATYIFSTQIKDFLGMGVPGHLPPNVVIPSEFLEKVTSNHAPSPHGRLANSERET